MVPLETSPGGLNALAVAAPFIVALVIQVAQLWALLAITERTEALLTSAIHDAGDPPVIDDLLPKSIGNILTWASDSLSIFTGILVPGIGILLLLDERISTIAAILTLLLLLGISVGLFVAVLRVSHPSRYLTLFYRWRRLSKLPEWASPIWIVSIMVTIGTGAASVIISLGQSA